MSEKDLCECGKPVKHVRTGECGPCYQHRWYLEHRKGTLPVHRTYPLPTVGYAGAHARVRAARGKAVLYPCAAECGAQASEWSYNPGSAQEQTGLVSQLDPEGNRRPLVTSWSPEPEDYEPLCVPCHRKKDGPNG